MSTSTMAKPLPSGNQTHRAGVSISDNLNSARERHCKTSRFAGSSYAAASLSVPASARNAARVDDSWLKVNINDHANLAHINLKTEFT